MKLSFILMTCLAGMMLPDGSAARWRVRVKFPVFKTGREAEAAAGSGAGVYQLVRDTLDKARAGIKAYDLEEAAEKVKAAVDAYTDAIGEALDQEVQEVINEVAAKFDGTAAVAALFDDALTYESSKMDAALSLWEGLVNKAEELETAGKLPNAAIEAISLTAQSIQDILDDTVDIVTYAHKVGALEVVPDEYSVNGDDPEKPSRMLRLVGPVDKRPWSGGLNVGYSKGRWSGSGSLSYQNGNFRVGGNIGYQNGRWSGGASLSYKWGR